MTLLKEHPNTWWIVGRLTTEVLALSAIAFVVAVALYHLIH